MARFWSSLRNVPDPGPGPGACHLYGAALLKTSRFELSAFFWSMVEFLKESRFRKRHGWGRSLTRSVGHYLDVLKRALRANENSSAGWGGGISAIGATAGSKTWRRPGRGCGGRDLMPALTSTNGPVRPRGTDNGAPLIGAADSMSVLAPPPAVSTSRARRKNAKKRARKENERPQAAAAKPEDMPAPGKDVREEAPSWPTVVLSVLAHRTTRSSCETGHMIRSGAHVNTGGALVTSQA